MWATCSGFKPLASLFGLAPGGVCRAADVATRAVRSYRTISPLPAPLARRLGGIFLLHFPWARAPQALPGTLARRSPDFPPRARARSDCLADSVRTIPRRIDEPAHMNRF